MTDDDRIAALLRHWQAPAPRPDAIGHVLAAVPLRSSAVSERSRRWLWPASLAVAAGAVATLIVSPPPTTRPSVATHEPVLEADAMATFFATAEDS